MLHALIMAGGSGTRLWPLSRKSQPKQTLSLAGERTMFQMTVDRVLPLIPPQRIHIVASAPMAELLRPQAPDIPAANVIVEPAPMDSGPAVGLGLAHIDRQDPDAVVAILSADHFIGRADEFLRVLQSAEDLALQDYIVTLGITPGYPSTGYGYIERGVSLGRHRHHEAYVAERFREKPDLATAQAWLADGRYAWNSGMFVMTCRTGWAEFERQLPQFAADLRRVERAIGEPNYQDVLGQMWPSAPKKSLDYAIMEGALRMAVVPVDMEWVDIGSWASLFEVMPRDADGNVVLGDHVGIGTTRSLVRGGQRLVATIGLDNVVIVDTPDALLVCAADRAQEVKALVDRLNQAGRKDVL